MRDALGLCEIAVVGVEAAVVEIAGIIVLILILILIVFAILLGVLRVVGEALAAIIDAAAIGFADIVEAGVARERIIAVAAGVAAPRIRAVAEALLLAAAAHAAQAGHQNRAADHAGCRRSSGAEEGRSAALRLRRTITWLGVAGRCAARIGSALRLAKHLTAVPDRTRVRVGGRYVRHRAARGGRVFTEQRAAQRIQEAALVGGSFARFELLDARGGVLERVVLQKHRLNQRVGRVWRPPQTGHDCSFRLGIARAGFELFEPAEQIVDQLALLRGHRRSLHIVGRMITNDLGGFWIGGSGGRD